MTAYDKALAHLTKLAKTPGWKEYAWSRAKELESCSTGMWQGIAADLKQAMLAQPPASSNVQRKHGR